MVPRELPGENARRFGYLTDATPSLIYWESDPAVAELCGLVCAPLRGDAVATAR